MKYCQLAIFPELETEIEIDSSFRLNLARRSVTFQVRLLSKFYGIPEYLIHLALVSDYMESLEEFELNMYVVLFLAQLSAVTVD